MTTNSFATRVQERGYWSTWVATLIFFAGFYALLIPLPRYLERNGLPDWQIGLVLGAFGVAALLGRPLAGLAADRWGPQPVLLSGAAALCVGALAVPATTNTSLLFALRLLQAAGYAAFTTASTALIISLSPLAIRAQRLAIFGAAANVSIALSPALVGLFLRYAPLENAFWLAAALAAFAGAIMWLTLSARSTDRFVPTPAIARLVPPRKLWLPMLATGIGGLGFAAFFQFVPLLADRRGMDGAELLYGVYGASIIATRFLGGRWLNQLSVERVLGIAFGIMSGGLAIAALATAPLLLGLSAVLIATGSGLFHPALLAHHARLLPDEPGRASAACYIGFDLGIGLGSWLLGLALQWGGIGALYGLAAGIVGASALVLTQFIAKE
jgi:predicted MFS family arabinose efflux permease